MKYLIGLLLACFTASAALNDVDKQYLVAQNILKNPGFESGKANWTASAGTFSTVTSGSNLLKGKTSATWNSDGAAQTLAHNTVTIPLGLYGKPGVAYCEVMTPSGTATHTLSVTTSAPATLATENITSNTNPVRTYVHFLFPTSAVEIAVKLTSVAADEPSITIDDCYLGDASGVSLIPAKPQDLFSAKISSADAVTEENVDWINGNCTNATTGRATCVFNSGIFSATPNCIAVGGEGNALATIVSTSSSQVVVRTQAANTATDTDLAFLLSCQKSGVDSPSVAFKPDTLANSWSGYHDNTCVWSRTNTALGAFTDDASCSLVQVTNNNFGTVSTSGSVSPAITFTPKRAGRYFVTASFPLTGSNAGQTQTVRLTDGTTVIADTQQIATATIEAVSISGIVVAPSTSAITIALQGAVTASNITVGASSTVPRSSIEWSIFAIDQPFPAPLLANSVVTKSNNVLAFETAELNCDAGSAITSQNGTWISSIGNVASGACTVTLSAGVFSAAPTCFINDTVVVNPANVLSASATSSTSVTIDCDAAATGTDCTAYDVNFMCVGPR